MATAAVERMLEGVDTRARLPDTGAQPQEGSSGHPQGLGGTALEGFPCVGRPLGTVPLVVGSPRTTAQGTLMIPGDHPQELVDPPSRRYSPHPRSRDSRVSYSSHPHRHDIQLSKVYL